MIELQERLYTSTEVAEILGVSLRSVYRYLEEAKLNAEVKTATGRHRFTKKNILDFLYPNGDVTSKPRERDVESVQGPSHVLTDEDVKPAPAAAVNEETPEPVIEEPATTKPKVEEVVEEEVDWLAKFREAAKKFKEEETVQPEVEKATYVEETVSYSKEPAFVQDEKISGIATRSARVEEEVVPEKKEKNSVYFYKSALGGLKDIAQGIDRNGRNSGVEYAFTLNAGLSLFKPIKPFSLLHVYVKPEDREFYEKMLKLAPANEDDGQLCLILSKNDRVFDTKTEMHGLYVVSKEQLLRDITTMGDSALASEAESVIS